MAGEAYYNTGTATVAVNSKTVTGNGTNWLSVVGGLTAIKAGDKFGIHVGRPIIIASVDSNTQLTLEDNWPGPAQTNAAYKIELTSPDVIAVEAMRRVLGSLGSGVLYGLSQLPLTPSKALMIDENGLPGLSDLSAFGETLIAAPNSGAAYGVLGVVPNGQLPTRLQSFATRVADWNSATESGVYFGNGSTSNTPVAPFAFIGFVTSYTATYFVQRLIAFGDAGTANNIEYVRECSNGTFSAWGRVRSTEAELDARYNRLSQPVANAQLPERLRPNGRVITDWNNATESGVYFGDTAANSPPGIDGGLIGYVEAATNDAVVQTVTRWWGVTETNSATWRRAKQGSNAWTSWSYQLTNIGDLDARYNRQGVAIPKDQLPNLMNATSFIGEVQAGVGDVGFARVIPGSTTFTGYFDFWLAGGTRAGYVGAANATQKDINLTAENGYRFSFSTSGGRRPAIDGQNIITAADFGQSLAANGWQRLPSGLILQWGSATTSAGNLTVAFPTAFPNACYGVFANVNLAQPSATVMYSAWADTWTLSNFILRSRYAAGGTVAADNMPANYWAVGR